MSIETILSEKTVEDLVVVADGKSESTPKLTDSKIEEVLKCLKYQDGCVGETVGNTDYIGLGDTQIAIKVGITVEQVKEIKAAREAKLSELSEAEKIEE